MNTIYAPEFARNYGFWNEDAQQRLLDTHVVIGGVGGDGYELGTKLARMGIGAITVADPEVFEPENKNRVPGAKDSTINRNKAEVFAEEVADINPHAKVQVFSEGITLDNIPDIITPDVGIVFDETELTHMELGTAIARRARELGIPDVMVMNVGFAGQVTSFASDSHHTFERMMGFRDDMPLDEVADLEVNFSRCLPYVPPYIDLDTFDAVVKGAPLPSIAAGVDVASSLGQSQALLHLVKTHGRRVSPIISPTIAWQDSLTMRSGHTRYPRASHYRTLAVAAVNDLVMHRNPSTAYEASSRDARVVMAQQLADGV